MNTLYYFYLDYLLAGSALLAVAILLRCVLRQPASRMTLARSTVIAMLLLAVVLAVPREYRFQKTVGPAKKTATTINSPQKSGPLSPGTPGERVRVRGPEAENGVTQPSYGSFTPEKDFIPTENVSNDTTASDVVFVAPQVESKSQTTVRGDRLFVAANLFLAVVMAARLAVGWIASRRLIRNSKETSTDVRISSEISSPVSLGFFRPIILLPENALEKDPRSLQLAIAHEQAHIDHGDLRLLGLLQGLSLLAAINPLYWLLRYHVAQDREFLADAAASRECGDRIEYARSLLNWARMGRANRSGLVAVHYFFKKAPLTRRITMLLKDRYDITTTVSKKFRITAACSAIVLGLLLATFTFRPAAEVNAQNPKAPQAKEEPKKFPLTFESEEALSKFLETYTPSPTTPMGKKAIDQQNLKMLGLAFHNYSDATKFLPSSSTAEDGTGKPMHSWRVALLPYLDHAGLYEKIRRDEPWDSEYNKQFHHQMPDSFRSPYLTDEQSQKGLTNYIAIVGNLHSEATLTNMGGGIGMAGGSSSSGSPMGMSGNPGGGMGITPDFAMEMNRGRSAATVDAVFAGPNSWSTFGRITDGTSNTILFAERSEPVCWMDPTGDVPIKIAVKGINAVKNGLGGGEGSEGINVVFCDGTVRFAPNMEENEMLEAALTCNGGEAIAWNPDVAAQTDFGVSVEGTVTLDGKPQENVTICFISESRKRGVAVNTIGKGKYSITPEMGLKPGGYRATATIDLVNDPRRLTFPQKYQNPGDPQFRGQLQEGANEINLELTSQ